MSTCLASQTRLRRLRGWNPHMEFADVLHVLWCGIARDMSGSILMDTAEFCDHQACPLFTMIHVSVSYTAHAQALDGLDWDSRLCYLHSKCLAWCKVHGIRPSTVEPFSGLVTHAWCVCVCVYSTVSGIFCTNASYTQMVTIRVMFPKKAWIDTLLLWVGS